GIDEYIGVTIISNRTESMRLMIINKLNKGVTIYSGSRGYGKTGDVNRNIEIIYTVVTRMEVSRLNAEIERIDPDAFVVMNTIKDLKGGMVRHKLFKH
ncbi:MAG TPA: YitT family protein, partial [Bacteroidales bacterium]|nr:YitT family protein [Bacteroidales bacterium]